MPMNFSYFCSLGSELVCHEYIHTVDQPVVNLDLAMTFIVYCVNAFAQSHWGSLSGLFWTVTNSEQHWNTVLTREL